MAAIRACVAIFGFALLTGVAQGTQVNPMDQVFKLMDELTAKIKKEGEAEEKAFKEFFEWCDDAAGETKRSLTTATSTKEKLTSTVEKASADAEAATTSIDELASSIATAEADLKAATEIRGKEAADFATVESELVDGVSTLERAIAALASHGSSAFIQKKVESSSVQALLETLNVAISNAGIATADKTKLVAMVQSQHSDSDSDMDTELGAPAAAVYEGHSGGILDILGDMKEKAEGELKDARKAENKAKHEFALLKKGLEDQLAAEKKELGEQKTALADAEETKASASGDLAETNEEIKALNANLETTSTDCMTGAQDHEDSKKARAEELAVIAKAKSIIEESTGGATARQYGFIQLSSRVSTTAHTKLVNSEVVAALKKLAKEQHSSALAQLASRVSAITRYGGSNQEDIFAKIKGLISDMITKLQEEAASEASHKAYCDEEMAKTKAKKEELTSDIEALSAKIDKAAAASAKLKEEVATLQKELAEIAKSQLEMDKLRGEESTTYAANKVEVEKGLAGVKMALKVLREYYAEAGENSSGGSGAAGGIISMLEVVESDFSKNLAEMSATEESAKQEYQTLTQENKMAKAMKEQDVKYKSKEFTSLDKAVMEANSDLAGTMTELDAIMEYLGKLNEQCVAKPEPYEERAARREAEIDGLKEALTILEGEAVLLQRKYKTQKLRGGAKQ
eukprot:gnl/TRDRNA2_/TRDRNA2_177533_c10_seq10.p1 gnl/TRDRNA2_/TRDRNA2_177533_c10~~gnl/TRDRNA2_/TRDRNA2_177533_c10_seq10.p1  ORF type:complete len:690 (+),score=262.64 gnl/TRDRNA2_/TRDRNA2_177533_c10_seq10:72-2141(+)